MSKKRRKSGGFRRSDIWPPVWRRRGIGLVFLLALATVVAFERFGFLGRADRPQSQTVAAATDQDRYNNRTFTCIRVVDGDTLHIDEPDGKSGHTNVRLVGVDTPETDKSPAGAMYFGAEASAFTRSLAEGKPMRVVLPKEETRDRYGRLLAYVYLGDDMLNEQIIIQGYGYAYTPYPHVWKQRFVDLEKNARKQRLGLWKDVKPDQMPTWRQRLEQRQSGNAGRVSDPSPAK